MSGFSRYLIAGQVPYLSAGGGGGGEDTLPPALIDLNFAAGTYTLDGVAITRGDALDDVNYPGITDADETNFVDGTGYTVVATDTGINAGIALRSTLFDMLPGGFVVVLEQVIDRDDERANFTRIIMAQMPEVEEVNEIGIKSNGVPYVVPYASDYFSGPYDFPSEPFGTVIRSAARFRGFAGVDQAEQTIDFSPMGRDLHQVGVASGSTHSLDNTIIFFVGAGPGDGQGRSTIKRARFYPVDDFPGTELQVASLPPGEDAPDSGEIVTDPEFVDLGADWPETDWIFERGVIRATPSAGDLTIPAAREIIDGVYDLDLNVLWCSEGSIRIFIGGVEIGEYNISEQVTMPIQLSGVSSQDITIVNVASDAEIAILSLRYVGPLPTPGVFPLNFQFADEFYAFGYDSDPRPLEELMEASTDYNSETGPLVVTPGQGIVLSDADGSDFNFTNLGIKFVGAASNLLLADGFCMVFEVDVDLPEGAAFANYELRLSMSDMPDVFESWMERFVGARSGSDPTLGTVTASDGSGDSISVAATTCRVAAIMREGMLAISINGEPQYELPTEVANAARNSVGIFMALVLVGVPLAGSGTLKWMVFYEPDQFEPGDLPGLCVVAGPPPELNPDPSLDLGAAGWQGFSNEGSVTVGTGSAEFADTIASDRLTPDGTNASNFAVSVPADTTLTVRVTVIDYVGGSIRCSLRGGAAVTLTDMGGGLWEGVVTSGSSGTGYISGNNSDPFTGTVTTWSIMTA